MDTIGPTTDLSTVLIELFISFLLTAAVSWIAAKVVSAPNDTFGICLVYSAISIGLAVLIYAGVYFTTAHGNEPPILAFPFWVAVLAVIIILVFKYWITMRLFEVGFLRAMGIFIIMSFLGKLLEFLPL